MNPFCSIAFFCLLQSNKEIVAPWKKIRSRHYFTGRHLRRMHSPRATLELDSPDRQVARRFVGPRVLDAQRGRSAAGRGRAQTRAPAAAETCDEVRDEIVRSPLDSAGHRLMQKTAWR